MLVSFLPYTQFAQTTTVQKGIRFQCHFSGKDSAIQQQALGIPESFGSLIEAEAYLNKLPVYLASQGYPVASVDSSIIGEQAIDAYIYIGTKYQWIKLFTDDIEPAALEQSGYLAVNYQGKPLNLSQLSGLQNRLLGYYEKSGYPFAAVFLDSVQLSGDKMLAKLKVDKGIFYPIDSIRVYGKVKIKPSFLQHYLQIPNGSAYNKEKLKDVDKRILELPYLRTLQPSDLSMYGTGAVLNLYLEEKKSSQVNFLVGFQPSSNNTGKLQVTGDINLDLKNEFGGGENILLRWQQLQPKSPRLNLGFFQPFIFKSPIGLDVLFDLFKKDSNFLQVNAQLGLQFYLSARQSGKLFAQWQSNSLLQGAIDTNTIIAERKLPPNIDISSANFGLQYEWNRTNYRFNPRKGFEINFTGSVGVKNVKKNNDILAIQDPGFDYASLYDSIKSRSYQFRIRVQAANFFAMGKSATFKTGLQAGIYNSPSIFRNELFQIGGYRTLRGFDEESIYATQFGIFTAEYRLLVGLNSYLSFFSDAGWVRNRYQDVDVNNFFLGSGIGILYETKLGLLNLNYAIGIRNDVDFNIREASKIHFGYINYF
jgi:outer membrane protein assembly factor BamA